MLCFWGITVSRCRYDASAERAAFSYHGIRFQTTTHKSGSQEAAEVPRSHGCGEGGRMDGSFLVAGGEADKV